jgi:hypothetical protein
LQIEGVLLRTPTPEPLEERDVEDLSPEEMRELLRRQKRARLEHVTPKQEKKPPKRERATTISIDDNASDSDDIEVVNPTHGRKRARRNSEVEVIDLS